MSTILNLIFLLVGFGLGVGSKVGFDYYHSYLVKQQKISEEMAEVLYRFKKMEEELSNKNNS